MPKISVIMPVYNGEKYLREAIDSILAQTFTDFEFIIINDCSVDGTEEIVLSYTDERIVYIKNEKNMGVAETLNRGVAIAKGEYIARMDADDISLPERFNKQVEYMDSHSNIGVCGSNVRFFGEKVGETDMPIGSKWCKANMFFSNALAHPSVIIRRSVLDKCGLKYDPCFERMEDFDLWDRVCEQVDIDNISDPLLRYRIHKSQVTQNHTADEKDSQRNFKMRVLGRLSFEYTDEEFDSYIKYCFNFDSMSYNDVVNLEKLCNKAYHANKKVHYYDDRCFYLTLRNCIWLCFHNAKLTEQQKKQLIRSSVFTPFFDRAWRKTKLTIRNILCK